MNEKKNPYKGQAKRMVERWAGKRIDAGRNHPSSEINHQRSAPHPFIDQDTSQIVEPQRNLPVLDACDVLVIGGGPAGLSAALSAKRAGADTILLERYGCFGGVITTVGMETIAWYRYEGTVDSVGIGVEMEKLAAKMGGTIKWPYNDSECLDADFFKIVADHLVTEARVRPYLHSLPLKSSWKAI
jgi:NADPH-dependent 2,4-dienoyl-CoA reductase/sulfur reductase-like enzyme